MVDKVVYWDEETQQQAERDCTPEEQAEIDARRAGADNVNAIRANLKLAIAQKRWEHETGGITINGAAIATERESQALITGAYCRALQNPNVVIDWKGMNGWMQIDAAMINIISDCVGSHVQACFSAEKVHNQAIDALTEHADLFAYNIDTGWPDTAYTVGP